MSTVFDRRHYDAIATIIFKNRILWKRKSNKTGYRYIDLNFRDDESLWPNR